MRTLLSDVDRGLCEPERVFDEVLNLLELGQEEQAIWQGNVDEIQTDAQAVVAMCYLVFNRWLPLFEYVAVFIWRGIALTYRAARQLHRSSSHGLRSS